MSPLGPVHPAAGLVAIVAGHVACMATAVATGSFFLGQPQVFPEPFKSSGIRPVLALLPLAVMFYWLARTRIRRRRAAMAAA
ncbi:MAG: hypothetical protein FJW14_03295 [Acidimicrobiia bacterium]|nr:hypothetical protein [Acidimicrobiia bacterium]